MNVSALPHQSPVSPSELSQRLALDQGLELLDVRSAGEYNAAHLAGAKLVPLDELDVASYMRLRGANQRLIYVLCQTGGRARRAITKFQAAGFNGCVLVEGGTQAWIDAGLPVIRGESKVLPLMRQVQIVVGSISALGAALALTVNPWFALLPLMMGSGLLFAGITGFCGLAVLLAKMPWNKSGACAGGSCAVK